MKLGLAILTFAPRHAPREISRRLPEAIRSLEETNFPNEPVIVDDGSTSPHHLRLLKSLSRRYLVFRRPRNGGISRAKNSCLRLLAEQNCDLAFIAEDDIGFHPGWWQNYSAAHRRTGIQHFSWAADKTPGMAKLARRANGHRFVQTTLLNGVLLSFTPEVLRVIGGFHLLPAKWGHEHTNWTMRIISAGLAPFFCDIAHSNRYISLNRFSQSSTVSPAEKLQMDAENVRFTKPNQLGSLFAPLAE